MARLNDCAKSLRDCAREPGVTAHVVFYFDLALRRELFCSPQCPLLASLIGLIVWPRFARTSVLVPGLNCAFACVEGEASLR